MLAPVKSRPPTENSPLAVRTKTGQGLDELRLTVAVDTRDPDDLAGAHLQGHAADGRQLAVVEDVHVLHLQHGIAGLRRLLLDSQEHVAPNHEARKTLLGRTGSRKRLDLLTPAEDRHAVGDLEHLVQLVADEDDRHPLAHEILQDPEELPCLLRGEHGSGLVEDQDVRAPVERLQDLDALLLSDGDVLDPRVRVDGEVELLGQFLDPAPGRREVEHDTCSRRLLREHDVLGDRHHGDEHEVLVHHADAAVDRLPRRTHLRGLPVDEDLAFVRVVQPVEDAHQRGLPRAVLAEQRMHLSAPELEVDVVVREHSRELLRDSAQFQNEVGVGHRREDSTATYAGDPKEKGGPLGPPLLTIGPENVLLRRRLDLAGEDLRLRLRSSA